MFPEASSRTSGASPRRELHPAALGQVVEVETVFGEEVARGNDHIQEHGTSR